MSLTVDINTCFGTMPNSGTDLSLNHLLDGLRSHGVAGALTYSLAGCFFDHRLGNAETLDAARNHDLLFPVAVLHMKRFLDWREEVDRCLNQGVVAFRFFTTGPDLGWRVRDLAFQDVLARLSNDRTPIMLSARGPDRLRTIAEVTADYQCPVILLGAYYEDLAELIAVMQRYPHIHTELGRLAAQRGGPKLLVEEVGARRILYGSGAPELSMQSVLFAVSDSDLQPEAKDAILGGNAVRLFRLPPMSARAAAARSTVGWSDAFPIIDAHAHFGDWYYPVRDVGVSELEATLRHLGVERCILSSTLGIEYDFSEGNRRLHEAIAGHGALRGYVVVNPHHLAKSCEEMDHYYGFDHFVGAKIHCYYNGSPTGSPEMRALIAEVARRGRPLLIHNDGSNWPEVLRGIAAEHPQLPIIVAHGGGGELLSAVADLPNVFLEFCSTAQRGYTIRNALDVIGSRRVLFGSDYTFIDPAFVLGGYMDAHLSEQERRFVMHDNAEELFNFPKLTGVSTNAT